MTSIEKVKAYLAAWQLADQVQEFSVSSATVALAAAALEVIPARIAKSITFADGQGGCIMVVAAGDAKVNSSKFKRAFGLKPGMLAPEAVLALTGHEVGGVCPFALSNQTQVFMDVSLQRFTTVFPACGSANSAISLTPAQLAAVSGAKAWVDVCNGWQEQLP